MLAVLAPGAVAYATATYSADMVVTNNSSTSYGFIPVQAANNNTLLITNGFMTTSGMDTRVRVGGADLRWMVADNATYFATTVNANTSNTYQFVTGQAAAPHSDIVLGYGGYVETPDAANLEPGNNYNISGHGYVDTTFTAFSANNTLIRKPDAYAIFSANTTGNVTAETYLYSTDNRTTALDLSSDVGDYQRYGSRISPYSGTSVYSATWFLGKTGSPTGIATANVRNSVTDAIIGGLGGINVANVNASGEWYRFDAPVFLGGVADIRVDIEYSGGDAANTLQVYVVNDCVGAATATGFSVGAWADAAPSDNTIRIAVNQSSISGIPSGYYDWTKQADGVNEWLTLDSSSAHYGSANSSGLSVPNNEMPLILFNTAQYTNNFTISVAGNQQLSYAPNNVILVTNLPDRGLDATNNAGVIHWGSNPSGITVSFGALLSTQVITANVTSSNYIGNFMPGNVTTPLSPTLLQANAAVATDPLYPFVEPFASASSTPVVFFYWFGTIIVAVAGFILAYRTKHLLISAIAFDIPFGYGIIKGYVPWWVIVILVIWTIGAAVQEARM